MLEQAKSIVINESSSSSRSSCRFLFFIYFECHTDIIYCVMLSDIVVLLGFKDCVDPGISSEGYKRHVTS